ncbi:hypothetical protein [Thiolapillus sp.]
MAKIFRYLLLLLGCSGSLSVALAAGPAGEQELLQYTQTNDMIASDGVPMLRVFDSGRVLVHLPAWKKNSGDYEYFLSDTELKALKDRLESPLVAAFDKARMERALHAAENTARAGGAMLFEISDNTYTHMIVNSGINGPEKDITWANLQNDAQRHTELKELVELADTERYLQKLLHHPKMKKLD